MYAKSSYIGKVIAILMLVVFPFSLNAEVTEEYSDNTCFSDQWIITRSASEHRNAKGVKALREVGHAPLQAKEKSASAVLVAPAKLDTSNPDKQKTEELSNRSNLCRSLDNKRRIALRNKRKGIHFSINDLRDFGCSCNYEVKASKTPNDPYYSLEWGLERIGAQSAWDITTGDDSVVVFVIDSGVDTSHPDLQDNLWSNPNEIPNDGIDNDNNGYVDDVHGINAISGTALRKN